MTMHLCTETATVFNVRIDPATGYNAYTATVLTGISWFREVVSTVTDNGLKGANRHRLRIPDDVQTSRDTYVDPAAYRNASDVSQMWTLQTGDIIVPGDASGETDAPGKLLQKLDGCTILGVTDNRRAPRGKHWHVIGA